MQAFSERGIERKYTFWISVNNLKRRKKTFVFEQDRKLEMKNNYYRKYTFSILLLCPEKLTEKKILRKTLNHFISLGKKVTCLLWLKLNCGPVKSCLQ
jgi:hypothetical protein